LEQAGAFVAGSDLFTLAGYLEHFLSAPDILFRASPEKQTVARTFLTSFDHLEKTSPAAAHLLCLLAFLAPDDIPIRLLLQAKATVPDLLGDLPGDVLTLDHASNPTRPGHRRSPMPPPSWASSCGTSSSSTMLRLRSSAPVTSS